MRQFHPELPLFTAAGAAAVSAYALMVSDFNNVSLRLDTSGSAACTIKIYGSMSEVKPDFSAAKTASNRWDTVDIVQLNATGSVIAGDTGIVLTTTDENANYELNVNNLRWVSAEITAWSAGAITLLGSASQV